MLGASGFVGGRLVERLVAQCGANVRILLRRVATGSPAVRFPVEVQIGDLADPAAIASAVEGCAVVFNCAKGTGGDAGRRRAVDVDAARLLVEAAARHGARVVHVSTFAVYDLPADGDVTERSPDAPPGDAYSDNKLAGERLVLTAGARLDVPVTVIQPTVVYGPWAGVHAAEILAEMRAGPLLLVNGGTGVCNAVYVDDVITAMLLAATSEAAAGERLLVSGAEHPTWADFFGSFERMLGRSATCSRSEAEALELWRRSRRRPWLVGEALRLFRGDKELRKRLLSTREGVAARTAMARLLPGTLHSAEKWSESGGAVDRRPSEPAVQPPRPWVTRYLAKRARVRIDKARTVLGYEPRFGLLDGMRLTEAWARWAGLLG